MCGNVSSSDLLTLSKILTPRFWAHWRTVVKPPMLLQPTARYVTLLYFALLYFTSLYCTIFHFTTLHFILLDFTSLHFTSLHFTSICFALLYFDPCQNCQRPRTADDIINCYTESDRIMRLRTERPLVIFDAVRTEMSLINSCMGQLSGALREYNVSGPCIISKNYTLATREVSIAIPDFEALMAHLHCSKQLRDIEKHSSRAFI